MSIPGRPLSNYDRASDVAVRVCVWQSTPRTANVTVTKIAVYVRVRILVNRCFFRIFAFIVFKFLSTFTRRVHIHLHAYKLCSAHDLCTCAEPCDWSVGAHGVTTMLGVSLRARRHTTQVMLGLSLRAARWDTILASTASTSPRVARVKY